MAKKPNLPSKTKTMVVDHSIHQPDIKAWLKHRTKSITQTEDWLRVITGKFWFGADEGISFYDNKYPHDKNLIFPLGIEIDPASATLEGELAVEHALISIENFEQWLKTDWVKLNFTELIDLLDLRDSKNPYSDHAFIAQTPYKASSLDSHLAKNPLYYDCKAKYNIYVRDYEEKIQDKSVPESILPNLQVLYSQNRSVLDPELSLQFMPVKTQYKALITLKGEIPTDKLYFKNTQEYWKKFSNARTTPAYKYFMNYGRSVLNFAQNSTNKTNFEALKDKFTNIVIAPEDINLLSDSAEFKDIFPMYVDLKFNTDILTDFAEFLKKRNLMDIVLVQTMTDASSAKSKRGYYFDTQYYYVGTGERASSRIEANILDLDKLSSMMSKALKTNDLAGLESLDKSKDGITLSLEEELRRQKKGKFIKTLSLISYKGKMSNLAKQHLRTYEEMMNGKPCYSEVVLYRIEKTDEKNNLIQNFFIPNSNDLDIINYVDTQIKYGKKYKYNIYAHYFVVGTKYWYKARKAFTCDELLNEFLSWPNTRREEEWKKDWSEFMGGQWKNLCGTEDSKKRWRAEYRASKGQPGGIFLSSASLIATNKWPLAVSYVPSLQLIEIPYFTKEIEVLDTPPIAPDVEILPYINKDDRLLFNFNRRVDEVMMKPVSLQSTDAPVFEQLRNSQQQTGVKINFKSDSNEPIKAFEVYRINKKPESYKDFAGKLTKTVQTECIANSAAFVDKTIKSNRKYYYTFRTIDIHDHFSNPSPVYEVELINDSGYIYPIIKVIEFEEKVKKQLSKPAKKYLYIKPSIIQTEIDPDQFKDFVKTNKSAKDLKSVKLGSVSENIDQIWDKKFKVRLKSKTTGRIIDLNFTFKHEFEPYKEEEERKDLC